MDGTPNHNPVQPPQGQAPMNGAPLNAQMMNFVGDPGLAAATAAAAAAASLYPNPAMFNNPSAFFAMPQMVVPPRMQAAAASNTAAVSGGVATKQVGFNTNSLQQPRGASNGWAQPICMTSGRFQGAMVPIQTGNPTSLGLPTPNTSSAMQAQLAAAAAAAAAVPISTPSDASSHKTDNLTTEEKAKQHRERNREHARSTRLRKKAYVQKLKELVEGLHAERTEEVRKRRVAMQHLAEKQNVRRAVVRSFLRFHCSYESDPRKWMTILEDNFWFKQPVTPYRAFRRDEIEQECRITRGIDGVIADAASLSVMVEGIGSRSTRWMQIKRNEVTKGGSASSDAEGLPHSIVRQNKYQHTISSLSSSSGSSRGSAGEEPRRHLKRLHSETTSKQPTGTAGDSKSGGGQKVSSSGSSNDSSELQKGSNEFHVYNAPSLPDPKLDSESSNAADDSQGESNDSCGGEADGMKQVCTDSSSSGDEDKLSDTAVKATSFPKRRKVAANGGAVGITVASVAVTDGTAGTSLAAPLMRTALPPNIAKSGGISHTVRPIATRAVGNGSARLSLVPPTPLPPFLGLGKRASIVPPVGPTTVGIVDVRVNVPAAVEQGVTLPQTRPHETDQASIGGPAVDSLSRLPSISQSRAGSSSGGVGKSVISPVLISADLDASSSNSSSQSGEIRAYYHVNEDDMLLTEDVLMCPFIFRSQDAVMCGALAECLMPGMLRAHFSPRNKLISLEMVYDSMGFMQQLERASGSEGTAQIVPGSLEMALSPTANEPRVITMAESPHLIVSVNAAWTKMTQYTQMEVEGKEMSILSPDASARPGKPPHKFSDVAQGRCACSTNILYGKDMHEFVAFVCSYPLTNSEDEITHILHVYRELPTPSHPHEFSDSNSGDFVEPMNTQ